MTERQHPASIDVAGVPHIRDAKGALVPLATVKATDLLMDEAVREMLVEAADLAARIRAFKAATFERVAAFQALLAQDYGTVLGGTKGNVTLTLFSGCGKVQVQVADLIEFGPELQAAKALIDECLSEWAATGGVELRALVNRVFSVDKQGQINRAELLMLMRAEITDPRWKRAMDAIRDSMRVIGSRSYIRFYHRDTPDGAWRAIPIDIAAA